MATVSAVGRVLIFASFMAPCWCGEPARTSPADAPAAASRADSRPNLTHKPMIESPDPTREARVYVRFVISAEGIPEQVKVEPEAGFHTELFRNTALRFVRGMRFEPAIVDGAASPHGPIIQPISFSSFGTEILLPEERGVRLQFRRELDKVSKLLKAREFEGAHRHAEWMLRDQVKLLYEFAALQAQLAQTHAVLGNVDAALRAAYFATGRSVADEPGFRTRLPVKRIDPESYMLPKETTLYLLELQMKGEAQRGALVRALKAYYQIAGLTRLAPDDSHSWRNRCSRCWKAGVRSERTRQCAEDSGSTSCSTPGSPWRTRTAGSMPSGCGAGDWSSASRTSPGRSGPFPRAG